MSDEFRKMERLCLEQAALSTIREAREALEKVARDYRAAAESGSAIPTISAAVLP